MSLWDWWKSLLSRASPAPWATRWAGAWPIPSGFEHVAAYTVAAFFLGLACHHRVPPVQLVLLLTAYGALLELGQLWVPGRNAQLPDIGADLAGASIGVILALVTLRLRSFALPR